MSLLAHTGPKGSTELHRFTPKLLLTFNYVKKNATRRPVGGVQRLTNELTSNVLMSWYGNVMVAFDVTSASAVVPKLVKVKESHTAFHLEGVPTLAPFAPPHHLLTRSQVDNKCAVVLWKERSQKE